MFNSSLSLSAKAKVTAASIVVQDSNFTDALNSEAIQIFGGSVLMNQTRFEQTGTDIKSAGVVISSASKAEIYKSVFFKLNSNSIGAGVSLSATEAYLANNTFMNNTALSGGALAIGQSGSVLLNNNSF